MHIQHFVEQYGYFAVFIGALLEGETVLILAAVGAHMGILHLPTVLIVAAVGAFIGDNGFFIAGRLYGRRLMLRFPKLGAAVPKVDAFVGRWHALAVVALRFTYGLRMAGPVILGAGHMKAWVFVAANAVGAVLWALLIGGIGFLFSAAVETMLGHVHRAEKLLLAIAVLVAVAVPLVHMLLKHWGDRRAIKRGDPTPPAFVPQPSPAADEDRAPSSNKP